MSTSKGQEINLAVKPFTSIEKVAPRKIQSTIFFPSSNFLYRNENTFVNRWLCRGSTMSDLIPSRNQLVRWSIRIDIQHWLIVDPNGHGIQEPFLPKICRVDNDWMGMIYSIIFTIIDIKSHQFRRNHLYRLMHLMSLIWLFKVWYTYSN